MPAPRQAIESFLDLISPEPNTGCWLWIGCWDRCGYGKFRSRTKETLAHRFSYRYFVGEIPPETEIDHKCRTRCCVNPNHLQLVSHAENVRLGIRVRTRHRNGRKTHCLRGHSLSGDNVFQETYNGTTMRKCLACRKIRQNKRREAQYGRKILET